MDKYKKIFMISIQQEMAYRLNFVMWRVRNIFQIFLVFFLWDSIFREPGKVLFGYDRAKILTYVFGILVVRAIVLSSRAIDVSGQVARGDISNQLLKPIGFFKYWLTRDFSTKFVNLSFAFVEGVVLYLILRPPLFLQTDPVYLAVFLLSLVIAFLIFFLIVLANSSIPFWVPEAAWGVNFIVIAIITEFLSGALFPLDVLPLSLQQLVSYTPFPYLIFFPIQVYLGSVSYLYAIKGILVSGVWLVLMYFLTKKLWEKGLTVYQAQGR
jgi:ABC-2 type transport system permease protein